MAKTLTTSYISNHQYFTARKDKYQMQSGKIVEEYFVVELPESACVVALTNENKIVMVSQYRHPISQYTLELPGGFIEKNEPKEQAIARELLEETGFSFSEIMYLGKTYANPGVLNNATHLFLAKDGVKNGTQHLDDNEEITIVLKSIEEVKEMLSENKIVQAMHELCIIKAFDKLGV
jgi:ADP-ribose pyrophosphatase